MSAVPNRWLKARTRTLIKACGGLEEASRACAESCRPYSTSHLSRCQTVGSPDYLPIDIVLCLEAYCGTPHVTSAMCEARPSAITAGDLRDELSDVVEGGAALLHRYRTAMVDGAINPQERAEFGEALDALIGEIREAKVALDETAGGAT
jgi:hypothetical protein